MKKPNRKRILSLSALGVLSVSIVKKIRKKSVPVVDRGKSAVEEAKDQVEESFNQATEQFHSKPPSKIERIDDFQQRHKSVGFPYAVLKKFGEDKSGNLAALLSYYAFLSIFPLMLFLVTVLGFALHGNPDLQDKILNSALSQFPIIGDQIKQNVNSLDGSGLALVVGLGGALYGGLAAANQGQFAFDELWAVPIKQRRPKPKTLLRSLILLVTVGAGILATTLLSGLATGTQDWAVVVKILLLLVAVVANFLLFWAIFRVMSPPSIGWKDNLSGAFVVAVLWQVLQIIGGLYVSHSLKGSTQTYGFFAIVIGLLGWLFLQAEIVLLSAEVNVVKKHSLWPRSLRGKPNDADRKALTLKAEVEERVPDQSIDVDF